MAVFTEEINGQTVKFDRKKDIQFVQDFMSSEESSKKGRTHGSVCDFGFRVIDFDGRVKTLAAAMVEHAPNEVVRPKNGNWFDLRRQNLHAIKIA